MDSFLRCTGIDGESTDEHHAGWIELFSFSLGVQKGEYQDVVIEKYLDSCSAKLAVACVEGQIIDEIVLELCISAGNKQPFMVYTFSDCLVISITAIGDPRSAGMISEQLMFSYKRVEWKYSKFDPAKGKPIGNVHASLVAPQAFSICQTAGGTPRVNQYEPNTAFILMWMNPDHPELEDVSNTIKDVCKLYSITAVRADDIQHEDKITDVILDYISKSEFLIADLSREGPNVYYEIGHAHAIEKRPFLYRRMGILLHFDLSIHNVREYRNTTELRKMLTTRLEVLVR